MLFENEVINISKIHTVNMYESKKEFDGKYIIQYNANLPVYELIFFISGEGITNFNDNVIKDEPNSIRFLPKGIGEGIYTVEKHIHGVCIDIYFDTLDEMPDYACGMKNMSELKNLFIKLYNIWNSKKNGYYSESMSIFYDIIRKIKKHNEKYFTNEQAKKIIPSYNYMLENFTKPDFDYKAMCNETKLSYDYFKELFIKQYGISPVKFVTMLRIEKAKELLITGHYSITEISQMCGFENVYYFSTVFKKHEGISPKKYKPFDGKSNA